MDVVEPTADEFFATASGVCVYVKVGHSVVRVLFASPNGSGVAEGNGQPGTAKAIAVATRAFETNKSRLWSLFARIAREQAGRS